MGSGHPKGWKKKQNKKQAKKKPEQRTGPLSVAHKLEPTTSENQTSRQNQSPNTATSKLTETSGLQSSDAPNNEAVSPRPKVLLLRLAVPLAVVGIGITLMVANQFSWGFFLVCLGLLWFAIDLWYEPFFRNLHISIRMAIYLAYVVSIVIVSWKWIFIPAPLEVRSDADLTAYGPGSRIQGIMWKDRYSGFRFNVRNTSSLDYADVDLTITTDLVIAEMKETGGLSPCNISPLHPSGPVIWQQFEGSKAVGPVNNPAWEYSVVPVGADGKPVVPVLGADWSFRIRCATIPAKSEIDFLAALEAMNPISQGPGPYPLGTSLFNPPRCAKWFSSLIGFKTGSRKRRGEIVKCPVDSTCQLKQAKWVW